jgi:flavin reductase (DIM6/NTAB) family NADH-FMN oxidoreductase RutF
LNLSLILLRSLRPAANTAHRWRAAHKILSYPNELNRRCGDLQPTMSISIPAAQFSTDQMYFLLRDSILPRPVGWVSSIDALGNTNLAPFSFFNVVSPNPAVLGFSCGPRGEDRSGAPIVLKDTLANIRATKEFVVNVSPEKWLVEMVRSSDPLPPGKSEFDHIGLTPAPSTTIKPPRIAGVPVAYECVLFDIIEVGQNAWVMGTVQHVHIDEAVYHGDKRVDLLKDPGTRPIGRLGRAFYSRIRDEEIVTRNDGGQRGT